MKRNREIARLYREEGLTPKGIGVRMELSATRVRQVLKRLGAAGAQPGSGKPLP
jgi:DNA-directed RNA polymerase specialized sigma subunit